MEIVFKELIKLNEVIREGSNPIQWRPYKKKKKLDTDMQAHRGETM